MGLNNKRICSSKRSTKTPISLPKRVGEVVVRVEPAGMSFHSTLKSLI
jgi:hypothetical protein